MDKIKPNINSLVSLDENVTILFYRAAKCKIIHGYFDVSRIFFHKSAKNR